MNILLWVVCVVCVLCILAGLVLYWLHHAVEDQKRFDEDRETACEYDRWEDPK